VSKRDWEIAGAMGLALAGFFGFAKLWDWWRNRPKVVTPAKLGDSGDCQCSSGQTPVRNPDGSCACHELGIQVIPVDPAGYSSPRTVGWVEAHNVTTEVNPQWV